jgi:hypothetical protein
VYLTTYSGTELPSKYIGSTSIEKVNKGYNGSVSSRKWRRIYETEQKLNKHLFKSEILFSFKTREEALSKELELQIEYDVVQSNEYFNESLASVNGCFGRDVSGKNNPMFGSNRRGKENPFYGKTHTDEAKLKNREAHIGKGHPQTEETKLKISKHHTGTGNPFYGKSHSDETIEKLQNRKTSKETKQKIKDALANLPLIQCPHCDMKSKSKGNMTRYHFDNCKFK